MNLVKSEVALGLCLTSPTFDPICAFFGMFVRNFALAEPRLPVKPVVSPL